MLKSTSRNPRPSWCSPPVRLCALLFALFATACSTTMPTGVGPFPKTIDVSDDGYFVCDRGAKTGGGCVDVTDYDAGRRNLLQHTLLSIATDECYQFKMRLYGWSRFGILSGGISHAMSAASAVLPHKATSRAIAAGGSASAAIGGDIDGYFRESKLAVALAGIELARTRVFFQIKEKHDARIDEYPVSRAFNDAVRYHAVCNLPDGLDEASGAVEDATERAAQPREAAKPKEQDDE